MKTKFLHIASTLLLAGSSFTTQAQDTPGHLWVSIENKSDIPTLQEDGKWKSTNPEVQTLIDNFSIYNVEQALPSSRNNELQKVYAIDCMCYTDQLSSAIKSGSGAVHNPEPAPEYRLLNVPDDYNMVFNNDYALDLIDAQSAWDITTGLNSVVIGVTDGNFYTNHEELQNEFVAYTPYTSPAYYYDHGTAVAVTAAGGTNNSTGKSSIGYNCKLSLASMSYNEILNLSYGGARVINISWSSGCYYNAYVQNVIDEVTLNGSIVVAAAGNGSTCGNPANLVYPAAHNNVIAVSSVGPLDNHERAIGDPASTHQHNSSVDICAPGYDVALTTQPGMYLTGNGTSFASPIVSGTIGLMLSVNPCLTLDDVMSIFEATSVNIDAQNPAYVGMLGFGRLDAGRAVEMAADMACPGQNNGNGNSTGNGNSGPIVDANNGYGGNGSTGTGNNGNGGNGNTGGNGNGGNGTTIQPAATTNMSSDYVDPKNPKDTNFSLDTGKENRAPGFTQGTHENFEVRVAPNPTAGRTVLRWNDQKELTVTIFDAHGALVTTIHADASTQQTEVELPEAGVYFLEVKTTANYVWRERVVRF